MHTHDKETFSGANDVDQYTIILTQLLDEYAPEKQHTVTIWH